MAAPLLLHLPAQAVQWLLIGAGMGSDPTVIDPTTGQLGAWPVYADFTPDGDGVPDEVLTVYDTDAMDDGQTMVDGEAYQHFGFQVRVRARSADTGRAKAEQVRKYLAETPRYAAGTADVIVPARSEGQPGAVYRIYNFARVVPVRRIGQDNPSTKRHLFTVNAVAPVRFRDVYFVLPAPAAYYPFDGNWNDLSGNGHTLTPDSQFFFPAGKFNTGTNPPPNNGVLNGAGVLTGTPINGTWTISFWALINDEQGITFSLTGPSASQLLVTTLYSDVAGGSDPGGFLTTVAGTTTLGPFVQPLGSWRHYAVVGDSGTLRMYANGVQIASTSVSAVSTQLDGGIHVTWTFTGAAILDDVAIIPVALTPTLVSYVCNGGTGRTYL